jgi:hypothetical protein
MRVPDVTAFWGRLFSKRFRVLLKGDGFLIIVNDELQRVGFFTTRVLDAATSEAAATIALRILWLDERLESRRNLPEDPASLRVEEVEEVSWFFRRFRPPSGFSFFIEAEK